MDRTANHINHHKTVVGGMNSKNHRSESSIRRGTTHGVSGGSAIGDTPKPSFRAVGLYVTLGRRLNKSCKSGAWRTNEEKSPETFDHILAKHEANSAQMLAAEKEKSKVHPIPKMSSEMRTTLCDLNKVHLIDSEDIINEHIEDDDDDIEIMEMKEDKDTKHNIAENKLTNRPRWNNFVRHTILPQQRILNSFKSTTVEKEQERLEADRRAREALKAKLIHEFKLPKVTETTEELLLRNSCFNQKLQNMKLCHTTGRIFKDSFVVHRRLSTTSTFSVHTNKQTRPPAMHRRAQSCQSYISSPTRTRNIINHNITHNKVAENYF